MTLLKEIFAHKRIEVEVQKRCVSISTLLRQIDSSRAPLDFVAALKGTPHPPALIAEVKMKSPSKGLLAANFDPITLAKTYAANGASAISVLTDEKYFGGSLAHLDQIAKLNLGVPLLRKEFICDDYQIYEARANGASAVLLIVAALSDERLCSFKRLSYELGMRALVEVHTRSELDRALNCGATLIGINNRDLHTFNVSLDVTRTLRPHIPPHVTVVAESGIGSREDVRDLNVDAILVGETIVRAGDVAGKIKELSGDARAREFSMRVKICGITSIEDALMCAEAGADFIGLNFYTKGIRYIEPKLAKEIAAELRKLPHCPTLVGVFVNETAETMKKILDECNLDLAQLSGTESDDVVQAMGEHGFKVIRNYQLPITKRTMPPDFLIDASVKGSFGGSGQTADWEEAATLTIKNRVILAGGLTPQNVARAIQKVKPWGVDVASGVESSPAKKDETKVKAFIERAKGAKIND